MPSRKKTNAAKQPQIAFPQLRRVELTGFTLYQRQPTVELQVPDGVACLAGANGIGKSTFLAAVNFGLTGSVPEPQRSLTSKRGYFEDARRFTQRFFDGRIGIKDQDLAEVLVEFDLAGSRWLLRRGVFDEGGLRQLQVAATPADPDEYRDGEQSAEERQAAYESRVTRAMGLEAFEQFVFLQHFVLTFDESRDLLFWNHAALERILRLAFGESVAEAHRADSLRREATKAGSLGRNYQWHATTLQGQIQQLRKALGQGASDFEDPEDLGNSYIALVEERDELEKNLIDAEGRLSEATAAFADAASRVVGLRSAYDAAFSDELRGMRADPSRSPVIHKLLKLHQCDACGADGNQVAAAAEQALASNRCPICASTLALSSSGPNFEGVRRLDEQLAVALTAQSDAATARSDRQAELATLRERYQSLTSEIASFETANGALATAIRQRRAADASPGATSLAALESSHAIMLQKRDAEYARRDRAQEDLAKLNKTLQERYVARRDDFTVIFRSLAGDFLGLEVDVKLVRRETDAIGLEFALLRTIRQAEHMLSESQRFFVDIALRMAIARFISAERSPAALFIDTPEGSLDIAYEIRAGELFAAFVNLGHSMLMTANINSSRLLLALAERCTGSRMQVTRMTEWATLSAVQEQHETEFSMAFDAIESALAR